MGLFNIGLSREESAEIISLAKAAGAYDEFLKGVSFTCHRCGAFIVKTPALLMLFDRVMCFMGDGDDNIDFCDDIDGMRRMLIKTVVLTDDEWTRHYTHGLKEYQFLYDEKGNLITDEDDGNPMTYVSEEVVFEFGDQFECRKFFTHLE